MACDFIVQLSKLRKLAAESVENTNTFDPFKKYLHVQRQVEIELRDLLRKINANQKKCLVMLCGSAGDGKSHLISYLKNSDSENLLADYEPYNDATESSEPTLTAIDTLAAKLAPFNDDNFQTDDNAHMIMAINLGTLNNFIESEKGKNFSHLKKYVEDNEIFSGYARQVEFHLNSVFQHVSFSDYQVFSLGEYGIQTDFLNQLLEKVFRKSMENPFYEAYVNDETCSMCQRCPVRHNYEFLSDGVHYKAIIRRIVEVVIMDKEIVSTREVLNLLYDLMVHPNFDYASLCNCSSSDIKFLTNYISWTTPMLLNEFDDISPLLNSIKKHDVLKSRNVATDEDATSFHSLENIENVFVKATENTPYQVLRNLTDVSILGGIKPELKKIIYRFVVRLQEMNGAIEENDHQKRLDEYIQYLYYQNGGYEKKLAKMYEATKKAVLCWDGQFDDDCICIDDTNEQFWILEQLQLKSAIDRKDIPTPGSIHRFSPTIKLHFKKDTLDKIEMAEISIDFALFELILDMKDGYRPTVQDKNRHTDFVSFVQSLIEFGNKSSRVVIVPKDIGKQYKIIFEENDFGFEFKVV
jgi:DNA phosphorothioation-dependent restriction protein DptF